LRRAGWGSLPWVAGERRPLGLVCQARWDSRQAASAAPRRLGGGGDIFVVVVLRRLGRYFDVGSHREQPVCGVRRPPRSAISLPWLAVHERLVGCDLAW